MDSPKYLSAHHSSLDLPEICIQGSNTSSRYCSSNRSNVYSSHFSPPSGTSIPMTIPNNRQTPPPPPLPPPTHPDLNSGNGDGMPDIAWQISNARERSGWDGPPSSSVRPGSSLYGSFQPGGKGISNERPDVHRRGSSASTIKSVSGLDSRKGSYPRIDEGYASLSGTSLGSNQSKWEDSFSSKTSFTSSIHDRYQSTTQAYDKSLLSKLSFKNNDTSILPKAYPRQVFSASLNDQSSTTRSWNETHHLAEKPLSLPALSTTGKGKTYTDNSLLGWAHGEKATTSPSNSYTFGQYGKSTYRSPLEHEEREGSSPSYTSHSGDKSGLGSEDARVSADRHQKERRDQGVYAESEGDMTMEETSGMRGLHIDDSTRRMSEGHSPGSLTGQKRRASSPPQEDCPPTVYTPYGYTEMSRRRELPLRDPPATRFHSNHGSISSNASGPGSNSYASNLSLAASSITTMSSYGLSPGGLSPGGISPNGISGGLSPGSTDGAPDSPYVSPRMSISGPRYPAAVSAESKSAHVVRRPADSNSHSNQGKTIPRQGVFQCECCPKKPKSFDTEDDLMMHQQEKQYECAYCKNRFKNKNEAERHQNSLHLRRHSWSCASLTGYAAAFHVSLTRSTEADTCGYCGEEFLRTGPPQAMMETGSRTATDRDWEIRIQHLQEVHKFGECNHAKKFFRADHFRQHLKHSHAGTSGKWTNMLENACMKDEPIPPRINEEVE